MAERFENLDNILHDRAKEKIQKSRVNALNKYEKQEKKKKPVFLGKLSIKKYSSSLSGQSSEIKRALSRYLATI